jgi:hypothetical protein
LKFAAILLFALAGLAQAQERFVFATELQARAVLGARDEYVRATGALERSAKLRTAEGVDEKRFTAAMQERTLAWSEDEQRALSPLLARLEQFTSAVKWQPAWPILLVKVSDQLEDGLPHTRGNALILPESMLRKSSPRSLAYFLSHEVFHVLSRGDLALREQLYAAIGFRPCSEIEIPAALARIRITNPDAPESRHTIEVRWRGQKVEVLSYLHFPSEDVDPHAGFRTQFRTSWLPVERQGGRCKARDERIALPELEGFFEQVGRNTGYTLHPEEIVADNFALLFLAAGAEAPPKIESPEVLERVRRVLEAGPPR